MANFNIVIQTQVNQAVSSIRQVGRELDSIEKAASKLRTTIRDAFAGVGLAFGIRELVHLTDTYIKLENRIRLVTKSNTELEYTMNRLFAISQSTRQSFDSSVTLFTRMASATKTLGVSQNELLRITESVNQAVAISGATSIEAHNALIQFSQGLASGRLGGEELRSVLEQLPAIADVIAKKLDVDRGALRDLAAQGELTPRVIIEAFQEARQYLSGEFAKTIPTLGQAFQVLQDQFLKFLGELNRSTGIGQAVAQTIILLANNMKLLLDVVTTLSIAWALRFVPAILASVSAAVTGVGAFISLAAGVTTLAEAQLLASAATVGWTGALGLLKIAVLSIPLLALAYAITRLVTGSGEAAAATTKYNQVLGEFSGLVGQIVTSSGERRKKLIEDAQAIIKQQIKELESLNTLNEAYLEMGKRGPFGALNVGIAEGFGRLGIGEAPSDVIAEIDIARAAIKKMQQDLAEAENLTKVTDPTGKGGAGKLETFDAMVRKLKGENQALGLNKQQRELANKVLELEFKLRKSLTPEQKLQYEALLKEYQLLKDKADILDRLREPQENLNRGAEALDSLMKEGKISTEEYTNELRKLKLESLAAGRDLGTGIQRGLLTIQEEFGNVADLASKTLVDSFKKAEDALVEFARTGKLNFKDLVNSMLDDLVRLSIRQNITAPLANALGLVIPGSTTTSGGGQSSLGSFASFAGSLSGLFSGGGQDFLGSLIGGNNSLLGQAYNGLFANSSAFRPSSDFIGPVAPSAGGFFSGLGSLLGFANGGSFMVGGSGPTDSQLVQFMATPGELVNISTPGQQANDNSPNKKVDKSQPIVNNWYITTPDANSFRSSQSQLEAQAARMISRARRNN